MRQAGLAEFPDAVTKRGAKHLDELGDMVAAGARAVMLYLIQIGSARRFALARDIDPAYGHAFDAPRHAASKHRLPLRGDDRRPIGRRCGAAHRRLSGSPQHDVELAARRRPNSRCSHSSANRSTVQSARAVFDQDQARPQCRWRVTEERRQDSVLHALDVDLECVDRARCPRRAARRAAVRQGTRTMPAWRRHRVEPTCARSAAVAPVERDREFAGVVRQRKRSGLIGTAGLAATLKASRAKLPGSGSIAMMRARPGLRGDEQREQPDIRADIDEHERPAGRSLRAISRAEFGRSSGSNICGVNSRFFSQPLSSGCSRIRAPSAPRRARRRQAAA